MISLCEENYRATDCNVFFNQVFTLSQTVMEFIATFLFELHVLEIQILVWLFCAGHCSRCLSYQAFSVFTNFCSVI